MHAFNVVRNDRDISLKLKPEFLNSRGTIIQLCSCIDEGDFAGHNNALLSIESNRGLITLNSPLQCLVGKFDADCFDLPERLTPETCLVTVKEMSDGEYQDYKAKKEADKLAKAIAAKAKKQAQAQQLHAEDVAVDVRHRGPNLPPPFEGVAWGERHNFDNAQWMWAGNAGWMYAGPPAPAPGRPQPAPLQVNDFQERIQNMIARQARAIPEQALPRNGPAPRRNGRIR